MNSDHFRPSLQAKVRYLESSSQRRWFFSICSHDFSIKGNTFPFLAISWISSVLFIATINNCKSSSSCNVEQDHGQLGLAHQQCLLATPLREEGLCGSLGLGSYFDLLVGNLGHLVGILDHLVGILGHLGLADQRAAWMDFAAASCCEANSCYPASC